MVCLFPLLFTYLSMAYSSAPCLTFLLIHILSIRFQLALIDFITFALCACRYFSISSSYFLSLLYFSLLSFCPLPFPLLRSLSLCSTPFHPLCLTLPCFRSFHFISLHFIYYNAFLLLPFPSSPFLPFLLTLQLSLPSFLLL